MHISKLPRVIFYSILIKALKIKKWFLNLLISIIEAKIKYDTKGGIQNGHASME